MNGSGSRTKGNAFERKIAKIFSDLYKMNVRRVPASGGLDIKCDLYCPEDDTFPLYIECKNRASFRIQSFLDGTSELYAFFHRNNEVMMRSYLIKKYNLHPQCLLIFKGGDFQKEMVMFHSYKNDLSLPPFSFYHKGASLVTVTMDTFINEKLYRKVKLDGKLL